MTIRTFEYDPNQIPLDTTVKGGPDAMIDRLLDLGILHETTRHCLHDFEDGTTCMLEDNHRGHHEPTPDEDIMITTSRRIDEVWSVRRGRGLRLRTPPA